MYNITDRFVSSTCYKFVKRKLEYVSYPLERLHFLQQCYEKATSVLVLRP